MNIVKSGCVFTFSFLLLSGCSQEEKVIDYTKVHTENAIFQLCLSAKDAVKTLKDYENGIAALRISYDKNAGLLTRLVNSKLGTLQRIDSSYLNLNTDAAVINFCGIDLYE